MNSSSDDLDIIRSGAGLVADVRSMIEQTREAVARTVNPGMTLFYWHVGRRIQVEAPNNQRAEYGREILATLSQEVTAEFGKGFSYSALTRMSRCADNFRRASIVFTLSRQLGWSHFRHHTAKAIFRPALIKVNRVVCMGKLLWQLLTGTTIPACILPLMQHNANGYRGETLGYESQNPSLLSLSL